MTSLASKSVVQNLLKNKGIRPLKKLGQNFLISEKVLEKVLQAAELQKNDIVLEIGPGIGTLTQALAQKVKQVIVIEKDEKMIEILEQTLKDFKNIEIITGDVLKTELKDCKLQTANYKLISNLPYYITSPIIKKFLESENPPCQMILMIQKEVAQRICAKPPKMSILAVSVQFYSEPEIISYVSKKCFWPEPKVDSAIIKIQDVRRPESETQDMRRDLDMRCPVDIACPNKDLFFKIVRAGFSHPRKQLVNNLSNGLELNKEKTKKWLLENKVDPKQRAQALELKNWLNLAKTYKNIIIKQ